LPALWVAMMYGMTLTFARSLGEFGAVLVVGGGIEGRTETTTLFIFRALEERQNVEAYAAALALGACSVLLITIVDAWRRRRAVPGVG
jgi:sulfate transport system permease protein